jgi:hypothetical protein
LGAWTSGSATIAVALTCLVAALVAQAVAVLRMRAWGILLGTATALGVLFALLVGVAHPTFVAITAMPGLALAGAVGAAWLRTPKVRQTSAMRDGGPDSPQVSTLQMVTEGSSAATVESCDRARYELQDLELAPGPERFRS